MLKVTAENLEKALFTTSKSNEVLHLCAVVFDKKRAISFRHGPHLSFKKDQKIVLHNVVNSDLKVEVVVSAISETRDFVVFEPVNGEFPNYPHGCDEMYRGQKYQQLGVNPDRQPVWKDGSISEKHVGFYIGTSHGKLSDSGSGIFNSSGYFLGISIGKKRFAFANLQNSGPTINFEEVADHHSDTQIISSDAVLGYLDIVGPGFEPPEKKHAPDTK